MPEVIKRTPETEKAQEYNIPDLIIELAKKVVQDTKKGLKKWKFTDEELIDIALSGVGAGTKTLGGKFPFNLKTTDLPLWDAILRKPAYFKKAKGLSRDIQFMSAEDYLRRISKGGVGVSSRTQRGILSPERIDKYAEAMKRGAKFPMPGIEYRGDTWMDILQEGRHRIVAAEKLGIDRIPILIIKEILKQGK